MIQYVGYTDWKHAYKRPRIKTAHHTRHAPALSCSPASQPTHCYFEAPLSSLYSASRLKVARPARVIARFLSTISATAIVTMSGSSNLESAQPTLPVEHPVREPADSQRTPSISLQKPQDLSQSRPNGTVSNEAVFKEREEALEGPSTLTSPPKKPGLSSRLTRMFSSTGSKAANPPGPRPESSVSQATTA